MCGIAGTFGTSAQDMNNTLERIVHRGPDGRAIHHFAHGSLGHARLAIVDLDGGWQLISDASETRWLVCNGEIYNHEQLRVEYADCPFKTQSDREAILAMYLNHISCWTQP